MSFLNPKLSTDEKCGLGIDGARGGWIASAVGADLKLHGCYFYQKLQPLLAEHRARFILIDMHLGLPGRSLPHRACDTAARKLLGPRRSSVFTPPSRQALRCSAYRDACDKNLSIVGKKISIQAWNLKPKLLEANTAAGSFSIHESHPELCFLGLAGAPLVDAKKTKQGQQQRIKILKQYIPQCDLAVDEMRDAFPRKILALDDIIDSIALALSAALSVTKPQGARQASPSPEFDERGQAININYWQRAS